VLSLEYRVSVVFRCYGGFAGISCFWCYSVLWGYPGIMVISWVMGVSWNNRGSRIIMGMAVFFECGVDGYCELEKHHRGASCDMTQAMVTVDYAGRRM